MWVFKCVLCLISEQIYLRLMCLFDVFMMSFDWAWFLFNIWVCFQDLGSSAGSKRPTCVILIKPHADYQDAYNECLEEVSSLPKPLWDISQSVNSSEVTAFIHFKIQHFRKSSLLISRSDETKTKCVNRICVFTRVMSSGCFCRTIKRSFSVYFLLNT